MPGILWEVQPVRYVILVGNRCNCGGMRCAKLCFGYELIAGYSAEAVLKSFLMFCMITR